MEQNEVSETKVIRHSYQISLNFENLSTFLLQSDQKSPQSLNIINF